MGAFFGGVDEWVGGWLGGCLRLSAARPQGLPLVCLRVGLPRGRFGPAGPRPLRRRPSTHSCRPHHRPPRRHRRPHLLYRPHRPRNSRCSRRRHHACRHCCDWAILWAGPWRRPSARPLAWAACCCCCSLAAAFAAADARDARCRPASNRFGGRSVRCVGWRPATRRGRARRRRGPLGKAGAEAPQAPAFAPDQTR